MSHSLRRGPPDCRAAGIHALWLCAALGSTVPAGVLGQARSASQDEALARALRQVPPERELMSHVRFLSHDLLEGRAPTSRGAAIAAQYIATQFEILGLQPLSEGQSFNVPVDLIRVEAQPTLTVGARQQATVLEPVRDFVAWPEHASASATVDGEVVFVGYGISALEWQWDDFEGASLSGKILLVLSGEPDLPDTSAFDGRRLTRFATARYKLDQAARVGARGVLLVHRGEEPLPWEAVSSAWGQPRLFADRRVGSNLEFGALISEAAIRETVGSTGRDFDVLLRRAELPSFRPIATGAHAVMTMAQEVAEARGANVIGLLKGRDPSATDEYVILVAHYDHLGIGPPVEGDSVYNGAQHNAVGISVLLAAAKAMSSAGASPRRSVLFAATMGGEPWHVGIEALLRNPPVPLERIVAVVNLDGGSIWGSTDDVVGLGAEESGLGRILELTATAERLQLVQDPFPEIGWFFRSDQLLFAEAGVPVVLLRPGVSVVDRPEGWGLVQQRRYLREDYLRPSDVVRAIWDLAGSSQQVRLVTRLLWTLAESEEFPTWNDGSVFKPAGDQLRLRRLRGASPTRRGP